MINESGSGDKFFKKYVDLDYDSFGAMLPTMDNFDNPLGTSVSILEVFNLQTKPFYVTTTIYILWAHS